MNDFMSLVTGDPLRSMTPLPQFSELILVSGCFVLIKSRQGDLKLRELGSWGKTGTCWYPAFPPKIMYSLGTLIYRGDKKSRGFLRSEITSDRGMTLGCSAPQPAALTCPTRVVLHAWWGFRDLHAAHRELHWHCAYPKGIHPCSAPESQPCNLEFQKLSPVFPNPSLANTALAVA